MAVQKDPDPVTDATLPAQTASAATSQNRTRLLFTLTVFVSALLLFLIQPLFGRKVLPLLGGAPGVWNTAMVFYQALLLVGYCYAHFIRRISPRAQLITHVALLAAAALTLPIGIAEGYPEPGTVAPFLWLMGLFAVSIGLPFLVVSTHAPLLQRWFSGSGDPSAHNPYFLYAASNLGSMLALIAYPLGFEPLLSLAEQAAIWSLGFVLLAGLVTLCGLTLLRQPAATVDVIAAPTSPPIAWLTRIRWLLLAAVPSGLLLAVTTMITTDIMAMPLLWMIPLILYLLTFVVVFAEKPWINHATAIAIAPGALMAAAMFSMVGATSIAVTLLCLALLAFFLITLACHGELVATRPSADRLTEFYIWMSAGGVVGGLFTALAAPSVFNGVFEYPLLLVVAALVLPAGPRARQITARFSGKRTPVWLWDLILPIVALTLSLAVAADQATGDASGSLALQGAVCLTAMLVLTMMSRGRPVRFALHLAACCLALGGWMRVWGLDTVKFQDRSFFGVYSVKDYPDLQVRVLSHGTTTHGAQSLLPEYKNEPQTYYARESGVGQVLQAAETLYPAGRIAAVGLGAGTIACYAKPGQSWSFYEIDPLVVSVAKNPRLFNYLSDCTPTARMVVGDARLTLSHEATGSLDVLVVDAFSSDAIPLHLITSEAFALYADRTTNNGIILLHISNRHLDLEPVVARAAVAQGLATRSLWFDPGENPKGLVKTPSRWIALAKSESRLGAVLAATPAGAQGWTPLATKPGRVWTDDYANLLAALKF
jgi:hypothetical protein